MVVVKASIQVRCTRFALEDFMINCIQIRRLEEVVSLFSVIIYRLKPRNARRNIGNPRNPGRFIWRIGVSGFRAFHLAF
jgi:hypothetical protein